MLKFERQPIKLLLGKYEGKGKYRVQKTLDIMARVYGLFGYCETVAGEEDKRYSIVHVKTGFTAFYCDSEKRARLVIKEIEKDYRYIFEFDIVPDGEYFKPHKPAIVYLRTLAQGGEVE